MARKAKAKAGERIAGVPKYKSALWHDMSSEEFAVKNDLAASINRAIARAVKARDAEWERAANKTLSIVPHLALTDAMTRTTPKAAPGKGKNKGGK